MTSRRPIQELVISRKAIQHILGTMRDFGSRGWEVLLLLLGDVDQTTGKARVTQVFVPKQRPVTSEDGVGYFVSGEALFELNKDLARTGLRLLAQVHSHPQQAFHSEADDRYAIVTEDGGLSIVVPDFGNVPDDPACWAVFRLNGSRWDEMPEVEAQRLFLVTDK